jgi:hypothetical protein
MATRQQFAQSRTSIIPELRAYIATLQTGYGGDLAMATQIRRLTDQLVLLEAAELTAHDDSQELHRAVADLEAANGEIKGEIQQMKDLAEKVETAAAIADIIQRVIGLVLV